MDHFKVTQICKNCSRGKKEFRVDLDLYDAEGKLLPGTLRIKSYHFLCTYCCKESSLDFYQFSHPDLICYLKRLHEHYTKLEELLDQILVLINKAII